MRSEPSSTPPETLLVITSDAWGRRIDQSRGHDRFAGHYLIGALKRAGERDYRVTVHLDEYEPCEACAEDRASRGRWPAEYRWQGYWCNACQAWGWRLRAWDKLKMREIAAASIVARNAQGGREQTSKRTSG